MANPEKQKSSGAITRRGLLLKETREAKGISLETVHEMCKIPMDVLHAIEEGYTVRMVSAYYFKGFIKMYAKYLGLDPKLVLDEPVVSKMAPEQSIAAPAPTPQSIKFNDFLNRQSKKQWVFKVLVGAVAVVVLIGIIIFVKKSAHAVHLPVINTTPKEMPKHKLIPPPIVEKKTVEKPKAKVKAVERPVPVRAPASETTEKPVSREETEKPVERSSKKTNGKKVNLTIRARVTGWLQVKVDGTVVFQSTMREGTAESWQADESIEISGKNINNLEFEVNGKVLGQLGKAERGARRVVITSEGLNVRK